MNFKDSVQLCKKFVNLYQSKIDKLNYYQNKYLNEIDYKYAQLVCNIQEQKNNQNYFSTSYKLSSCRDVINIEPLNYQFNLEEHFIYLFTNEDHEYFKDFESQKKNLIISLVYVTDQITDLEKEKISKIKNNLHLCQNKLSSVNSNLNKYKELIDGLNENNKCNQEREVHIFIGYINRLLLLNSIEDEENILNNDQSVRQIKFLKIFEILKIFKFFYFFLFFQIF